MRSRFFDGNRGFLLCKGQDFVDGKFGDTQFASLAGLFLNFSTSRAVSLVFLCTLYAVASLIASAQ